MPFSPSSKAPVSLLRAPLIALGILALAALALAPLAALGAQSVSNGPAPAVTADTLPVPVVDGEVSDLLLKGKQLEVRYRNTGSVATMIVGELQVRDANDEVVLAVPFADARRVEAGRAEKFRLAMPHLAPGHYTLFAVVDFGGETMTAAQAALEIRP
ncbi:MAG TPA: hypothetical protein DGD08_14865 [Gemmatimonas aurantiaca]|nr:hypothetical protein [Gemmatimonas aurantiaca]HCT58484.1 hypothetical protein [Gemmatimonas aurantiaca]